MQVDLAEPGTIVVVTTPPCTPACLVPTHARPLKGHRPRRRQERVAGWTLGYSSASQGRQRIHHVRPLSRLGRAPRSQRLSRAPGCLSLRSYSSLARSVADSLYSMLHRSTLADTRSSANPPLPVPLASKFHSPSPPLPPPVRPLPPTSIFPQRAFTRTTSSSPTSTASSPSGRTCSGRCSDGRKRRERWIGSVSLTCRRERASRRRSRSIVGVD